MVLHHILTWSESGNVSSFMMRLAEAIAKSMFAKPLCQSALGRKCVLITVKP